MKSYKELSKGAIKAMLADVPNEQGKDHILQACPTKAGSLHTDEKKFMMYLYFPTTVGSRMGAMNCEASVSQICSTITTCST